jgi:hypothetical protein
MSIVAQTLTVPAVTDYEWLRSAIEKYMHRDDLQGDIADFISLTEARIKAMLWSRDQEAVVSLPTVAGQAYINLPSDFLHARAVSIPGVNGSLSYTTPDDYFGRYPADNSGAPRDYTLIDGSIYFGPVPDKVYSVSLTYQGAFIALSPDNPSNVLLSKWPNLYLWGALVEAAGFSENAGKAAFYDAKFMAAMSNINYTEANGPGLLTMRAC